MNRTIRTLITSGAAIAAVGLMGVAPASAKAGDVVVRGDCSGSTDYKLKLKNDNGNIEYEYEVDSNVNGQRWNIRMTDNGVVVFRGARLTVAPSGSLAVNGLTANQAGTDRFAARATNPATGEVCLARARI
jgi:hypothetical protein